MTEALPSVLDREAPRMPILALAGTRPLQRQAGAAIAAVARHEQAALSGKAPGQAQRAAPDCPLPLC